LVPLDPRRSRTYTGFTRILILLALIALIVGALFYALFSAQLAHNADVVTYSALATAVMSLICPL